jgi:hypothetical protein
MRPPPEKEDSLFNRVFASVFIVLLLAVLGGIFVAWAGQSAMYRKRQMERREPFSRYNRPNDMIALYYLGIRDWRFQFAIGATIGAGCGLFYIRKNISWKRKREGDMASETSQS